VGLPVDVFVPTTTLPIMVDKLRKRGANVIIGGENWNAADKAARAAVATDQGFRYIPPFDDPLIWEGNSSIVDEIKEDFGEDSPPDAIVLSVGGGGLLAGVQLGLDRVGASWRDVPIIAVETEGAASFAAAKAAGHIVKLEKIATVATSLGALAVTPAVIDRASLAARNTRSIVVSDAEAVAACLRLADEHRFLVEPACGAALAAVYSDRHIKRILDLAPTRGFIRKVVVIVCGGSAVNLDLLHLWREKYVRH
jgi:L-serine/L-threonine ammonia-lyase